MKKKKRFLLFLGKKGTRDRVIFFFFWTRRRGIFGGNVNRKKESSKDEKKNNKTLSYIYIYIYPFFLSGLLSVFKPIYINRLISLGGYSSITPHPRMGHDSFVQSFRNVIFLNWIQVI